MGFRGVLGGFFVGVAIFLYDLGFGWNFLGWGWVIMVEIPFGGAWLRS